jgi:hypothetical protein
MKIEVTDTTALPEWMQSHVSEGHLDLTAIPQPEDVSGLKSALAKERDSVSQYAKLGKPDEIQSRIAELTEKAKGTGKGAEDAQAKLDAMEQKYSGEISARDERINKMMQRNALSELKAELGKAGFIAEAIDDIALTALNRVQYDEDGAPQVVTPDGKAMIGSGANHGATLADLAKELAGTKAYAVRDAGKSGGGKPTGSSGGTPTSETVTRAQWDSMSHVDRSTFSKSGGKVKD